jgi:hypothetical protein
MHQIIITLVFKTITSRIITFRTLIRRLPPLRVRAIKRRLIMQVEQEEPAIRGSEAVAVAAAF